MPAMLAPSTAALISSQASMSKRDDPASCWRHVPLAIQDAPKSADAQLRAAGATVRRTPAIADPAPRSLSWSKTFSSQSRREHRANLSNCLELSSVSGCTDVAPDDYICGP